MWFGTFLNVRNLVTAEQLVSAVDRQWKSRDCLGTLALKMRMMTVSQISQVLRVLATDNRPFGRLAIELGLLSDEQLNELLGTQSLSSPPLDEILVEMNILSREQVDEQLAEWHAHLMNSGHASSSESALLEKV